MMFNRDAATDLGIDDVEALKAVSRQYHCALVTEHGVTEQSDGDYDLDNIQLDDGLFATVYADANPPEQDATLAQLTAVGALSRSLDAPWLFESMTDAEAAVSALEDGEWAVAESVDYGLFTAAVVLA